jgi:hypothetical protein
MKTNITKIAAAIALSVATLSSPLYATDKNPKKQPAEESTFAWTRIEPIAYSKKVEIAFQSTNSDRPASVRILNEVGEVVYREHVKHPHIFRKIYDLNELGEGIFTLQISTDRSQTEKKFALSDVLHTDNLRVIFLPGSDYKSFRFGMENLTKVDANLLVKDSAGKVVYQEKLNNIAKRVIEKDFSYLKSGEYTVEVSSAKGEFSKKMLVP